ncbi:troponin C, isotype gamma-like isoform X2 [Eriocheir sinensis]|uniref:troponin C, isotype gamma-like isoform X2 n=1 Tax=Eriocheir sinensis TaxID=95602 RepID=UPI0021C630DF|nr:troponin C, isotype gamma-like isoform X2 [Eriocheir sinensis]
MNESIVDSLDKEQIAGLRKAFDAFDTDKKGSINVDTITTILRMMGVKVSESNLREIISEVDEDGSGELEFEEFCALAAKFLIEEDEESLKAELKEAFRIYDKQGDGYITTKVLKEILRELDNKLTEEDLDGIIDEVDEDGSGTLDFDEFMEMMTG